MKKCSTKKCSSEQHSSFLMSFSKEMAKSRKNQVLISVLSIAILVIQVVNLVKSIQLIDTIKF